MPTKKKSCELVQQGIAGPAPDQILDAIKAEYWLPADTPQTDKSNKRPDQRTKPKTSTQVKP